MPDRIKPMQDMVIQYFQNTGPDETPVGAKITRVISDTKADIEFYTDGGTHHSSEVPVLHPLDGTPTDGKPYAKFLPRHDVASERHLMHPDRTATEGQPQRGEGADSRVLPTVEHVSEEDPLARSKMGLPAEKTEDEKVKEKAAGIHSVKDDIKRASDKDHEDDKAPSKSEERRHAARQPDPSLKRK